MTKADRAAREAAALRANLLKRKQQSRLRQAVAEAAVKPSGDSAKTTTGDDRASDGEQAS